MNFIIYIFCYVCDHNHITIYGKAKTMEDDDIMYIFGHKLTVLGIL
jgi:hypothetical protein